MEYRTEIDGLRAIAVCPVILFHAGFETFSGGFVGVDVFFVISGFLITSSIIIGIGDQNFSLFDFYERRARRILPALFFVILVCLPLAWLTMVPYQLEDFSESLIATTAFASNYLFYIESRYFEAEAELKPLLHTWSLAVEEQFYIIFPLAVLLLSKLGKLNENQISQSKVGLSAGPNPSIAGRRTIMLICSLIAILCFAWSYWSTNNNPPGAFYLLPSRGWEILAGSLVALHLSGDRCIRIFFSTEIKQFLSGLGIVCIVVPIFLYQETTIFPGLNAIAPVAGVVLVLIFATDGTAVNRILSHKGFVMIGLVSYSAYLWHQPLFSFARLKFGIDLPLTITWVILTFTAIVSFISWRYVETPFRSRKTVGLHKLIALFFVTLLPIILFAVAGVRSDGFYEAKLASIPWEYSGYLVDREAERKRRWSLVDAKPDSRIQPFDNVSSKPKVLIVGDSISDDLFMSLSSGLQNFDKYQFRRLRLDDRCVEAATAALRSRERLSGISDECYLEVGKLFDSELYIQSDEIVLHTNFRPENVLTAGPFLEELIRDGKRATIVGVLVFDDIPSVSMKIHKSQGTASEVFYSSLRGKFLNVNDQLRLQANELTGVRYLDKFSLFCSANEKRCNIIDSGGKPIFFDGNHMTVNGFSLFGQKIGKVGWW